MAVGWDHLLPAWFTRLHVQFKTPVNSIVCIAGVVLLLPVLATVGVHAQEAFQVLANASMTHYELMYMAMFAIPLVGAATVRKALPGWLKWVSLAGFCASLYSFLTSTFPFVDVVNPRAYAAKIGGTVVVSNLVAIAIFKLRNRKPNR
jgi:amino acid transporter